MPTWAYAITAVVGGLYGYATTRDPLGVAAGAVAGLVALAIVGRVRRALGGAAR